MNLRCRRDVLKHWRVKVTAQKHWRVKTTAQKHWRVKAIAQKHWWVEIIHRWLSVVVHKQRRRKHVHGLLGAGRFIVRPRSYLGISIG